MGSGDATRSKAFVERLLDMHPQPFKSFFSRFITERVGDTGLTESQIVFLLVLDTDGGMSLKDMTEKMGVHKSLTTRAVKHLLDNGFVINTAESGKEHSVVLTAKGTKARKAAIRAFSDLFELILEDLTDEELTVMEQAMSKIRHKMEELSSKEQLP
ncbi:MAG: MarR family transcriptional regulator [Candidatus Methanoplasma sp.]|nr:MarR family transcriptional regulator [Candidatus Methanoplasma sp.]